MVTAPLNQELIGLVSRLKADGQPHESGLCGCPNISGLIAAGNLRRALNCLRFFEADRVRGRKNIDRDEQEQKGAQQKHPAERLTAKAFFRHHFRNPNSAAQSRRAANKWPSTGELLVRSLVLGWFSAPAKLLHLRTHILRRQEPEV
jgi:hypothetical protein